MAGNTIPLEYPADFKIISVTLTEAGLKKAARAKVNRDLVRIDTPIDPDMWHKEVHDEIMKVLSDEPQAPPPA